MAMRRTPLLLLALVLVAAPPAACGDDDLATGDDPVTDDPGGSVPAGPGTDPPAPGPVVATPGLLHPIPSAIESVTVVPGGDGSELEVFFYNGVRDCYGLDRVEVEEADESVTIGVFTGALPPGDQVCIEIAERQSTLVRLGAPLGSREVVDASTGAAVPVG